jgi:DNA-binding GntR family transcriptional regulator
MTPPPAPATYARLRALLVRGELAPGARVGEDELATRLGVSRTPVREAMRRLQLEGLLVTDGGGARPRVAVAPLRGDEAREVYRAAGALEGMAARAAAALPPAERAALADALRALDDALGAALGERGPHVPDRLSALHHAFHRRLAEACAGPVTLTLLDTLRPRLERYEWFHAPLLRRVGADFGVVHDEHRAIVDAVRGGAAEDVERAVRANWDNAAERLGAAIEADRAGAAGRAAGRAAGQAATQGAAASDAVRG